MKRTSKGFTLIELIMVIVILGILAAVAIPKFVDLSASAAKSACEGMKGSIASACSLYYANEASKGRTACFPADTTILGGFLNGGWKTTCVGGKGTYTYNPATGTATCSNAHDGT